MNVRHSFTLVELMIVIAILAILSAVVIFTLNPSEIFKKNRDSIRLADMKTVYKAISFIEAWNTSGINIGDAETIYLSLPDSSSTCSSYDLPSLPTGYFYSCKAEDTYKNSDGTG
jgi:prepilin-type N-terminal cleavage/methylation domain-containing protein